MVSDSRVLVTGGRGQLGKALRRFLPNARFPERAELELTDPISIDASIKDTDIVIHAAALTDVDRCEREPDAAFQVNATATEYIATAAQREGTCVIFISTDYVFDGRERKEYAEYDDTAPLNVYGASKLAGELAILAAGGLVVRSSWVLGDGTNFVRKIVGAAREGRSLKIVSDQFGRPTLASDLARAVAGLVDQAIAGVIHIAGTGFPCSWAELAAEALRLAGLDAVIGEMDSDAYAASVDRPIAPRPRHAVLDLTKAGSLGIHLEDWRTGLARDIEEIS